MSKTCTNRRFRSPNLGIVRTHQENLQKEISSQNYQEKVNRH